MNSTDRLPDEAISFILEADTVFIGSTYEAPTGVFVVSCVKKG